MAFKPTRIKSDVIKKRSFIKDKCVAKIEL
jgi:hypothetical protein